MLSPNQNFRWKTVVLRWWRWHLDPESLSDTLVVGLGSATRKVGIRMLGEPDCRASIPFSWAEEVASWLAPSITGDSPAGSPSAWIAGPLLRKPRRQIVGIASSSSSSPPSSSSAPGGIILGIWAEALASDSFLAFFRLSSPWEVEARGAWARHVES